MREALSRIESGAGAGGDDEGTSSGTCEGRADAVGAAREIALRRLSVRARSRSELARDLRSRDVPAEAAAEVLERFTEVGLIDDAAFAAEWVESRGHRSGASRLRQELRQKGVAEEHIAEAIGARDGEADLVTARELAVRRLVSMAGLDGLVRQRRLAAFLARRGFSSSVIRRVVVEVLEAEPGGFDD